MARDKTIPSGDIQTKDDDQFPGGLVEGFASTFDNIDLHGDVVKQGAFRESIAEFQKGQEIPFLDSHRMMDGTGAVLGRVIDLQEKPQGLFFRAALSTVQAAQDLRTKIKEGIVKRLSIGFNILEEKPDKVNGVRVNLLTKIRVREVSAVVFPANTLTAFTGVKLDQPGAARSLLIAMLKEELQRAKIRIATSDRRRRRKAEIAERIKRLTARVEALRREVKAPEPDTSIRQPCPAARFEAGIKDLMAERAREQQAEARRWYEISKV